MGTRGWIDPETGRYVDPNFNMAEYQRDLDNSRADGEHREELLRWAGEGHGHVMRYRALCRKPLYAGDIKGNAARQKEIDKILRELERAYRHQHSRSRFIRWITKSA